MFRSFLALFAIFLFSIPQSKSQGLAEAQCQAQIGYLNAVLDWRAQGIPIDSIISHARDQRGRMYDVLTSSVQMAYQNPDGMKSALSSGAWLEWCTSKMLGG